jgi:hypothetical protein
MSLDRALDRPQRAADLLVGLPRIMSSNTSRSRGVSVAIRARTVSRLFLWPRAT